MGETPSNLLIFGTQTSEDDEGVEGDRFNRASYLWDIIRTLRDESGDKIPLNTRFVYNHTVLSKYYLNTMQSMSKS
jgi:hypothetical protein